MHPIPRASSILVLSAILGLGCGNAVILQAPSNAELIGLDHEASPELAWDAEHAVSPEYSVAFRLLVYENSKLVGTPVLRRESLDVRTYRLEADEGWLRGNAEYYWKVEADLHDRSGAIVESLRCDNPRSFYLDRRPVVPVDLRFPDDKGLLDLKVRIGSESFGPTPSIQLEHGERRTLSISFRSDAGEVRVLGSIKAIGHNEQLKYESVVIDDVTAADLREVAGGSPLERVYRVGENDVVRLSLY